MEVLFLKEITTHLNIPKIPKKEWDGTSFFKVGVAILELRSGERAYAVASFREGDNMLRIRKVFSTDVYTKILGIYPVPAYMDMNIDSFDVDEESKKRLKDIAKEIDEIENSEKEEENTNPYFFDNIHNDEEARAFIESYMKRNRIKGNAPKKHDSILMRLSVIYSQQNKK